MYGSQLWSLMIIKVDVSSRRVVLRTLFFQKDFVKRSNLSRVSIFYYFCVCNVCVILLIKFVSFDYPESQKWIALGSQCCLWSWSCAPGIQQVIKEKRSILYILRSNQFQKVFDGFQAVPKSFHPRLISEKEMGLTHCTSWKIFVVVNDSFHSIIDCLHVSCGHNCMQAQNLVVNVKAQGGFFGHHRKCGNTTTAAKIICIMVVP